MIKTPTVIALGNFDGVHRGHRAVIEPVLRSRSTPIRVPASNPNRVPLPEHPVSPDLDREAEAGNVLVSRLFPDPPEVFALNGSQTRPTPWATVVTFSPHPQEFFTGQRRTLLTPVEEKAAYLKSIGIEQLVRLPFNQVLANLSPQAFVEEILVGQLQAQRISVGQNFCFGRKRSGTTADLQAIAAQFGVEVTIVPLQTCQNQRISSSEIRQALLQGNIELANRLLGRPYRLLGSVVQGQQLGRTLGFPTANLHLPPEKFLPRKGVYGVWVSIAEAPSNPVLGVMNLGDRPTVNGRHQTVEVHLLDWSGDLYGRTLEVQLAWFLRPEYKFSSLDALKAQIQLDSEITRTYATLPPPPDCADGVSEAGMR